VGASDFFKISRARALLCVSLLVVVIGLAPALSHTPLEWRVFDRPVLDWMDTLFGDWLLPLGVLITVGVIGWVGGGALLKSEERP